MYSPRWAMTICLAVTLSACGLLRGEDDEESLQPDGGPTGDGGTTFTGVNAVNVPLSSGALSFAGAAAALNPTMPDATRFRVQLLEGAGACSATVSPGGHMLEFFVYASGPGATPVTVGTYDESGLLRSPPISVEAYISRWGYPTPSSPCGTYGSGFSMHYVVSQPRSVTITAIDATRVTGTYRFKLEGLRGERVDVSGTFDAPLCDTSDFRVICQ
ncbi:hypothetical protein [Hyalangium gracile]|uniref:hypothetical protein n=1 Tax=Hyalangium gracile TaxID=394092 RepID=UPI001CCA36DA|nr:hypothetical protein [Hyalangium gracile]